MPSNSAGPPPLVSAGWLAERLTGPDVQVLDCRWRVDGAGQQLYAHSHVARAVHIDWATELVRAGQSHLLLAEAAQVATAIERAGLGEGTTAVLYDDTQSLYAARVWWSLKAYGFQSVSVLDGGWPAWVEYGGPTQSGTQSDTPADAPAGAPTSTPIGAPTQAPVAFTPRLDAGRLASTEEVARLVGGSDALIIDARSPSEYLGQGGAGPRRGHIPGALNVPAALLVQEGGRLPAGQDLARIFTERGIERGSRIVVYDAAGLGAAKVCLALELLGFNDVALYDAGWGEWADQPDESHPIEA